MALLATLLLLPVFCQNEQPRSLFPFNQETSKKDRNLAPFLAHEQRKTTENCIYPGACNKDVDQQATAIHLEESKLEPSAEPETDTVSPEEALRERVQEKISGTFRLLEMKSFFNTPQSRLMPCPKSMTIEKFNITFDGNLTILLSDIKMEGESCAISGVTAPSPFYTLKFSLLQASTFRRFFTGEKVTPTPVLIPWTQRQEESYPSSCSRSRVPRKEHSKLENVLKATSTRNTAEKEHPNLRWGSVIPRSVQCGLISLSTGYSLILDAKHAFPQVYNKILWETVLSQISSDGSGSKSSSSMDSSSRKTDNSPLSTEKIHTSETTLNDAEDNQPGHGLQPMDSNSERFTRHVMNFLQRVLRFRDVLGGIKGRRKRILGIGNVDDEESMSRTEIRSSQADILDRLWGSYIVSYYVQGAPEACYYAQDADIRAMYNIIPRRIIAEQANPENKTLRLPSVCGCMTGFAAVFEITAILLNAPPPSTSTSTPLSTPSSGSANSEEKSPVYLEESAVMVNGKSCKARYIGTIVDVLSPVLVNKTLGTRETFMAQAISMKLLTEMVGETQPKSNETLYERVRKVQVTMRIREHSSRVVLLENGTTCGGTTLVNDTVLLIENINLYFQIKKLNVTQEIPKEALGTAVNTAGESSRYSIHAFKDLGNNFSVCSYSSSTALKSLIEKHCTDYRPLGSKLDGDGMAKTVIVDGRHTDELMSPSPSVQMSPTSTASASFEQPTPTMSSVSTPQAVTASSESPTASVSVTVSPSTSVSKSTTSTPTVSPSPSKSVTDESTNGAGTGLCFPGAAQVKKENGELVAMSEVQLGDMIVDARGKLSRVILLAHNQPDVMSEFVYIEAEGADIVLSPLHYLVVSGRLRKARSVRVGEMIEISSTMRLVKVKRVAMIREKGLFAPVTSSGTLSVRWSGDSVSASCYTADSTPWVAHAVLWPVRMVERVGGIVIASLSRGMQDGNMFLAGLLREGPCWTTL